MPLNSGRSLAKWPSGAGGPSCAADGTIIQWTGGARRGGGRLLVIVNGFGTEFTAPTILGRLRQGRCVAGQTTTGRREYHQLATSK